MPTNDKPNPIAQLNREALADFFSEGIVKGERVGEDFEWERCAGFHVYKVRTKEEGGGVHQTQLLSMDEVLLFNCDVRNAIVTLYGGTPSGAWRVCVPEPGRPSRNLVVREVEVDPELAPGRKYGGGGSTAPAAPPQSATDVNAILAAFREERQEMRVEMRALVEGLWNRREDPSAVATVAQATSAFVSQLSNAQAEAAKIRAGAEAAERQAKAEIARMETEARIRLDERRQALEEQARAKEEAREERARKREEELEEQRERTRELEIRALEKLANGGGHGGGDPATTFATQLESVLGVVERVRGISGALGGPGGAMELFPNPSKDDEEPDDSGLGKLTRLIGNVKELVHEVRATGGGEQPAPIAAQLQPGATPPAPQPVAPSAEQQAGVASLFGLVLGGFKKGLPTAKVAQVIERKKGQISAEEWDAVMQADAETVGMFLRAKLPGASQALVNYAQEVVATLQGGDEQGAEEEAAEEEEEAPAAGKVMEFPIQ